MANVSDNSVENQQPKPSFVKRIMNFIMNRLPSGETIDQTLQAGAINYTDIQHTTPRVVQVFSNVIANAKVHFTTFTHWIRDLSKPSAGNASDASNPNSYFNHMMYKANGQLTPAGIGTIAASGLAFVGGLGYSLYKVLYNRYLRSKKRLKAKMSAYADMDVDDKPSHFINIHKDKYQSENPDFEIVDQGTRNKRFAMRRVKGSVFNKTEKGQFAFANTKEIGGNKTLRKKTRLNTINRISNSRAVALLAKPWNWMVNQSMWYWVTWFFAVMIVGGSALSLSTFAAPVLFPVALVTVGIGITLSVIKFVGKVRGYRADKKMLADISKVIQGNDTPDTVFNESVKDIRNYINNQDNYKDLSDNDKAKIILAKYKKYKAQDDAALEGKLSAWMTSVFTSFAGKKIRGDVQVTNAEVVGAEPAAAANQDTPELSKRLRDHIIPSNHERRLFSANRVIGQMAFGFVIPFFITSLLAAVGLAILPHLGIGLTAAAIKGSAIFKVINGVVLPSIWGVVKTVIFGVSTIASRRQAELDYKIKVASVMTKDNVSKFNELEKNFYNLKKGLEGNVHATTRLRKQFPNFETWDPYNTAFFEEHSDKRTAWSWTRKGMRNLLEPFAGSQTGVLIIRFTCLAGMVGLGFVTGGIAPAIFLTVAAVAGVILAANRLVSWHLDRRQKHRENFLNTFNERIEFMKDVTARFEAELAPQNNPENPRVTQAKMLKEIQSAQGETPFAQIAEEYTPDTDTTFKNVHCKKKKVTAPVLSNESVVTECKMTISDKVSAFFSGHKNVTRPALGCSLEAARLEGDQARPTAAPAA